LKIVQQEFVVEESPSGGSMMDNGNDNLDNSETASTGTDEAHLTEEVNF
jgi:hypothetical protein